MLDEPFLVLLVLAKDECAGWPGWLEHHRRQGVEHFYIIDNMSTKRCFNKTLSAQPDVTVWRWSASISGRCPNGVCKRTARGTPAPLGMGGIQVLAYNEHLPKILGVWLGVMDLDEYAFGVELSLASVLKSVVRRTTQLCLPWLVFGSSGHERTPSCLPSSNLYRARSAPRGSLIGKCFQRRRHVRELHVHRSLMINDTSYSFRGPAGRTGCICPDLRTECNRLKPTSIACKLPSKKLLPHKARVHHYKGQSREHMCSSQLLVRTGISHDRGPHYWYHEEAVNNWVRDTTLEANPRVACNASVLDPAPFGPAWFSSNQSSTDEAGSLISAAVNASTKHWAYPFHPLTDLTFAACTKLMLDHAS